MAVTAVLVGEETRLIHGGGERSQELEYDQNNLAFEFAVLDFQDINWNARTFMLEGWDPDWRGAGDPPNANYQNLPPGTYTFRVRAQTSDGYIPESEASVRVTIHPPYWQTWWFRGLVFVVMGTSLYALYRNRLTKALAMEHLRLRIADDLHDDIGSRLSGVALHADLLARSLPSDSSMRDRLTDIGLTVRTVGEDLRDVAWIINPEYDSVPRSRRPDEIDRRNDAGRPSVRVRIPREFLNGFPRHGIQRHVLMMFKEMLNNIVRHARATTVRIEVSLTDNSFRLCVADNGIGFDPSAESDGRGLASMRTRAEGISGVLSVESTPGSGSRICLEADITRSGN